MAAAKVYRNYIYEYYAKINSGEVVVGEWIKKVYEIVVNELEKGSYFFNAKKANKAIKFIENFCHHSQGRNDYLTLELWQKALISCIFGIVDDQNIRFFREIFIVVGRKNGKSLFASAIIAYMAFLEPEYGQEIYCLAPKLEQAAKVYDAFLQMVDKEPELKAEARKRRSDLYIDATNSFVKPIAFNAKKSDGFNPQLVVCDEIAAWSGDGGLKQYEVMKSALGARRQPMILSISTAGYINDSIYDELYKRSTSVLKGNSKERRLLPFLYIMLDAGHYGKYNRSPANAAYYESDFAWKFHLLLKAALEYRGFTVGTTRDAQANDLDLSTRGRKAAGYDLFISIHSNAVGSGVNNSVDYPVAITMVNDDKTTIDEVSKAVGERLAQAVAQVMQTKQQARTYTKQSSNDRDGNGIFDDEYYGVLHGAKSVKVPGLILEHSFHTNATATAWLLDDNHLQQMAEAEAATLADYYGMKQTLSQAAEEKPSVSDAAASAEAATWYRVRKTWEDSKSQLGAFRVKDNAVKNCPEGYSVFDEAGKAIYTNKAESQAAATWYRVRKIWEDAASQVGAYKVYDNAVRNCPEGYAVFDDAGKVLHRNACSCTHEVKSGDTLGKLAKEYGTTVETIVAANKAKYSRISANYIVVGWKLKV